jgi:hypothetical protein
MIERHREKCRRVPQAATPNGKYLSELFLSPPAKSYNSENKNHGSKIAQCNHHWYARRGKD